MNRASDIRHTQSYTSLEELLWGFSPITLAEMADVSLLNRIDTKYLIHVRALPSILEQVQAYYRILEIDEVRLNQYHTVYYDEADFTFYNQHHNRHADRYKVRARQYVDTNISFFEVKHKTNKKRTIKSRLHLEMGMEEQHRDVSNFVEHHAPVDPDQLEQKLWNDYRRFTLVDQSRPERVTVDLSLSFGHKHSRAILPGFAIVEVKQEHFTQNSHFIQQMRRFGIRSSSFSKYCAGVYMLYDDVKTNNFKPVMRHVEKLIQMGESNGSIY